MIQTELEKVNIKEEPVKYSKPEVEELELNEGVTPEMQGTGRSGMGNCKHTYI